MAPGVADNLIVTAAYKATPTTVTLAWSAGLSATVTWTSHGLSVGDYISLQGASPTRFVGTFRVESVTDANNVVIALAKVPASGPTGTVTAVKSTRNWHVRNGSLDQNYRNIGTPPTISMAAMGIVAAFAQGWSVRRVRFYDVRKYCIHAFNTSDFHVDDMIGETNSDGVHIFGPAFNGLVQNVSGGYGDDAVALSSRDIVGLYSDVSGGDILGITFDQIRCTSPTAIAQIYAQTGYDIDDIEYRSIGGTPGSAGVTRQALSIYGDATGAGGYIRNLKVTRLAAGGHIAIALYQAPVRRTDVHDR
jgi:hypothetical protein